MIKSGKDGRALTKYSHHSVQSFLRGHVHQPPTQAVVREDEEDLPTDGPDVLQLLVIKVFQHKSGHCRDYS